MESTSKKIDFVALVSSDKITLSSNPLVEIDIISSGIHRNGLLLLQSKLGWDTCTLSKAIGSSAEIAKLEANTSNVLNPMVSENLVELAKITSICVDYFQDIKRWNIWLNEPNLKFNNKKPISVIHTIRGRMLIRQIVNGLKHGFTA
ncbi:antitoxin Xre/MbcA/ParS toxin-binding domain-containing protein [Pseudoalteromonas sp. S558]|uniref:antitoxin Xre/MbcA/ParS toxin-binding domain-containing protein n=1 Tax=Pseudoalteromonas sp. S558 TaxID=2066515 RepID=UPI00110A75FE|nr:antitoxin Xre/MbcA/ParS toxin-binding domain-containing protein [Pseudoalteromonas sp. S558]TMO05497.1 hypothetical protein CWB66_06680 [Pseudoalteromonas sp. S558]